MYAPSGENTGSETPAGKSVSCLGSPPSTGMIHSWLESLRLDENNRLLPSGENTGPVSLCLPLVIRRRFEPSIRIIQICAQLSPASRS